jgi:hypothetical protein
MDTAVASRKLLQLLKFVRPEVCSRDFLCRLLAIFFCVDVKLYHRLIDWYAQGLNAKSAVENTGGEITTTLQVTTSNSLNYEKARKLIHRLKRLIQIPIIFHVLDEDSSLCLAHLHSVPQMMESAQQFDLNSIVVSMVPSMITNSAFTEEFGKAHSYPNQSTCKEVLVPATVALGDFVMLRGTRESWQIVHELNTVKDCVVLRRATDSDLNQMFSADAEHPLRFFQGTNPHDDIELFKKIKNFRFSNTRGQSADAHKYSEYEIREVDRIHFIGCIVCRLPVKEPKRSTNSGGRLSQCFYYSLPSPSVEQAVIDMQSLVQTYEREQFFLGVDTADGRRTVSNPTESGRTGNWGNTNTAENHRQMMLTQRICKRREDPLSHMQTQSVLRLWLQNKQIYQAVADLFLGDSSRIDACCAADRVWWLQICRALKSISRGGKDLLSVFEQWTRSLEDDDASDKHGRLSCAPNHSSN